MKIKDLQNKLSETETDYYMQEGCGIFAMALSFLKPGGKIFIASNNDGEKWSKSIPFEVTHVVYYIDGKSYDASGETNEAAVAKKFNIQGSMSIKGPYQPMDFFKKFMGNNDTKPLYGTKDDIKEAMIDAKKQKILEYNLSDRQKQNALDNKATIIITMPPEMFLNLTTEPNSVFKHSNINTIKDKSHPKEKYQQWIDQGDITVHPFLDINEKTSLVDRHEGRSRAYAAMQHGDKDYEVAIHLTPYSRQLSIKDVPDVWVGQFNRGYKINFRQEVQKGIIKILNDNVQKRYQKVDEADPAYQMQFKDMDAYWYNTVTKEKVSVNRKEREMHITVLRKNPEKFGLKPGETNMQIPMDNHWVRADLTNAGLDLSGSNILDLRKAASAALKDHSFEVLVCEIYSPGVSDKHFILHGFEAIDQFIKTGKTPNKSI